MEHEQTEKRVALRSALVYLPIAVGAALLFSLAASLGNYSPTAVVGGAVWIGLLTLIVAMPIVTSRVKTQWRRKVSGGQEHSIG